MNPDNEQGCIGVVSMCFNSADMNRSIKYGLSFKDILNYLVFVNIVNWIELKDKDCMEQDRIFREFLDDEENWKEAKRLKEVGELK